MRLLARWFAAIPAATLQGHYLDSNPAGWDLRGNLASQAWDTVVLQDNSTQALPSGSGTVTFAAGSSTATVTIDPTADTKQESDETLGITLSAGNGYAVGTTSTVTGTSSAWIQRHAAANSRCRARIVRSPVMATAAGRFSTISCTTQSSARSSSSPKWMSETWNRRVLSAICLHR